MGVVKQLPQLLTCGVFGAYGHFGTREDRPFHCVPSQGPVLLRTSLILVHPLVPHPTIETHPIASGSQLI